MYNNINTHKDNPVLNHNNFKPIAVTNGLYQVSPDGEILSIRTNKILSPFKSNKGYSLVITSIDSKVKKYQVHRLVAMTFIPNPENKPQVNHIDGDKGNNSVSNLEWVTAAENVAYAIETGLDTRDINRIGGKQPNAVSKYNNVACRPGVSKPWSGSIKYKGKRVHCKWFSTEVEAALHVNWIYDELGITNRPRNIIE